MGIFVNSAVSSEIPVAPPSIKSFGNKKLSNPKAAENTPATINKIFLMFRNTDTRNNLKAFACSYVESGSPSGRVSFALWGNAEAMISFSKFLIS